MKIHILYEDRARRGFKAGVGFSCWISGDKNILFDTGWDSGILSHNMESFGLDPKDIDILFVSHQHWDHDGGIPWVLQQCRPEAWVPKSFSGHMKEEISRRAELQEVGNSTTVCKGIHTTGELGSSPKEQSLLLESEKGLVVITGCSHPGLDSILNKAREFGDVHALLGGFHGFDRMESLKSIPLLMPCHCTKHIDRIREIFPSAYREAMAGDTIEL